LGIFMRQQQAGHPETYSVFGCGAWDFGGVVSRAPIASAKSKAPIISIPPPNSNVTLACAGHRLLGALIAHCFPDPTVV
jgi:hypothetical protein